MALGLTIPKQFYIGFERLLRMDDNARQELIVALKDIKPALTPRNVASQIADKTPSIAKSDLALIVSATISLRSIRARKDYAIPDIANALVNGIKSARNLSKPDGWETPGFAHFLEEILSPNETLEIVAKALGVLTDHEHVYCGAKILTEIRPIFGTNAEESPETAVLTHMLKISYHENKEHKEFFVALDTKDVRDLLEILQRADAKTRGLKAFFKDHNITYLDVEQD